MNRSIFSLILIMVLTAPVLGKGTWEEQQARAEKISAEYQAKHPNVRSDRFVVKTVTLPDDNKLVLDLRLVRPKAGGPFPVVFYVHGGAWGTGSKAQFTHESYVLAEHGIAGVRLEYRWKSHGARFPEAISDVLDAIDYIRKRANELNLDFTRVGLVGGSAGGHLSAIAAQLTPECICYDGFNGLYDAWERNSSRFGGGDYTGTTEQEKKRASAMYIIKDNPPDTLLIHGTEDTTIDVKQAYRFAEAIRAKGGKAETLIYEGVGHGFFNKEPYRTVTTRALLDHTSYVFGLTKQKPDFTKHILKPKTTNVPAGFDLLGKWWQKKNPKRIFEFRPGKTAVSPAGENLKWDESYGNYYIFWKTGSRRKIEIHDAKTITIGKTIYLKGEQK